MTSSFLKHGLVFTLLTLASFSLFAPQAKANGQDLNVSCTTSTCTVTQGDVPFFNELNLVPGQTFTRKLIVKNNTSQTGNFAIDAYNLRQGEEEQIANLAAKIKVVVRRSSPVGTVVYGGTPKTLQDLITDGFVPLGSFSANQQDTFYFTAAFLDDADNQYQSLRSIFDMDLGFEFIPNPPAPGGPSGLSVPTGGGDPNGASTPVCSDTAPRSAASISFAESNTADGQVTLQWTAVAGADHYAINFGIQPGVYVYGNNNVGNITTYTVTGLAPGNRYYFQVLAINGCAPGPRSNEIATTGRSIALGTVLPPPTGFTPQQVLGVSTEASQSATPAPTSQNPSVLGTAAECVPWKPFLPIVFMVIQFVVSVVIYMLFRDPESKLKQVGVVIAVIVSTVLFYYLRKCDCSQQTVLAWLCQWYFVIAIAEALVTQFINYALIEREE